MQNLIDGKMIPPMEGKTATKISPWTGEPAYTLPASSELDVAVAVRAAHKALKAWSESKERAAHLLRLAELIQTNAADFARAESEDLGVPPASCETDLVKPAAEVLRAYAGLSLDLDGARRQPVGVAGIINSWTSPLLTLCERLAPALLCGNTCVIQPHAWASGSASLLANFITDAGLPAGVCNFVYGAFEPVATYLVKHPGVPLISFAGDTAEGEKIYALSAPFIKKLSLDLGGKNVCVVLNDVDLAEVIPQIARACFAFSGQNRDSASRILVQEGIAKDFTAALRAHVEKMEPVAMVNGQRFTAFGAMVALAKKENGRVLCGGDSANGFTVKPVLIEELTNCSEIHQSEALAPLATINTFKYPFDAAKLANVTPFGRSASVWAKNIASAEKIAASLEVGTVWINTWLKRDWTRPRAFRKTSGHGIAGGTWDLDFFSELKSIIQ